MPEIYIFTYKFENIYNFLYKIKGKSKFLIDFCFFFKKFLQRPGGFDPRTPFPDDPWPLTLRFPPPNENPGYATAVY